MISFTSLAHRRIAVFRNYTWPNNTNRTNVSAISKCDQGGF